MADYQVFMSGYMVAEFVKPQNATVPLNQALQSHGCFAPSKLANPSKASDLNCCSIVVTLVQTYESKSLARNSATSA